MYERILVATSFNALSDTATEHAMRLAQITEASVILLHVIESIGDDPEDPELQSFYDKLRAKAAENMRALAARYDELGVPLKTELQVGVRWRAITEAADRHDADLVVVGSRSVLGLETPHLGSTSHQVFFAGNRPLLVIR